MKKTLTLSLILTAALSGAQVIDKTVHSGSLWTDGSNPMLDRTARKIGDLLTIIVSETSSASFTATTTSSKKDSNAITNSIFNNFLAKFFSPAATGATSGTSGSGNAVQSGKVSAKVQVTVKQVMPNGNLVVEGKRQITVNRDTQTVVLTGVVRRDDIRSDNSIYSEQVADADIRMEGKGLIYDRQRRGLLTRLLDWLF